jgi:hypothetical protein
MINTRSSHIGHSGMAEIMEMKSLDTRSATGGIKGRFDGIDRVTLDQEHMVFMNVADFIQAPE